LDAPPLLPPVLAFSAPFPLLLLAPPPPPPLPPPKKKVEANAVRAPPRLPVRRRPRLAVPAAVVPVVLSVLAGVVFSATLDGGLAARSGGRGASMTGVGDCMLSPEPSGRQPREPCRLFDARLPSRPSALPPLPTPRSPSLPSSAPPALPRRPWRPYLASGRCAAILGFPAFASFAAGSVSTTTSQPAPPAARRVVTPPASSGDGAVLAALAAALAAAAAAAAAAKAAERLEVADGSAVAIGVLRRKGGGVASAMEVRAVVAVLAAGRSSGLGH